MRFLQRLAVALVLLCLSGNANANPMLLVDAVTTEVIYASDDAGQPWHPASLTKLMTAYVAFAAIATGRVSLDTPVKISRNAWNQAPSKSGLEIGSSVTLRDGLYIMLVKSANDMAVAIAETISGDVDSFVAEMNRMSAAMGLTATNFVNPHGLHNDRQVTSARDLAVLALYIIRDYGPQYGDMFRTEAVVLGADRLESNNGLLTQFPGTTGMKTGYVCASGLNIVATVERQGLTYLAVVLGSISARERNEMAAEMVLKAAAGDIQGSGLSVINLPNISAAPVDMRPNICGKNAKAYVAQREKAFPMGLKGQPSYLSDGIEGAVYVATDLGDIVTGIPLPRRRPSYAPTTAALD